MGEILLLLIWLIPSYYIGLFGQNKNIGFWGAFALSFFLTPIIGIIAVALSGSKS